MQMINDKPLFGVREFTWDRQRDVLVAEASSLGLGVGAWPSEFFIAGGKTRDLKRFVLDQETMIMNEFFDGEVYAYRSAQTATKVRILNT